MVSIKISILHQRSSKNSKINSDHMIFILVSVFAIVIVVVVVVASVIEQYVTILVNTCNPWAVTV